MNAQKFNHLLKKIKYDKNAAEPIYDECSLELQAHIQRRFGELINSERCGSGNIFKVDRKLKRPKI